MSALIVTFSESVDVEDFGRDLCIACPYFQLLGDWYDFRKRVGQQATKKCEQMGFPLNDPTTSDKDVEEARKRGGKALLVQLILIDGSVAQGSFSSKGMNLNTHLLMHAKPEKELRFDEDANAANLIACILRIDPIARIEVL